MLPKFHLLVLRVVGLVTRIGKTSTSVSDTTPFLWPPQDEVTRRFNLNDTGPPLQSVADLNLPRMAPVSLQRDDGPPGNMAVLPCLKSMTWVMENKSSTPGNRVAVINLKLQDYGKTPSTELEVKFQLSRVTLEPMLRSMAYISEQLSTPANRVAVINLKVSGPQASPNQGDSLNFELDVFLPLASWTNYSSMKNNLSTSNEEHFLLQNIRYPFLSSLHSRPKPFKTPNAASIIGN
ncbi:COMM DOMAIN-CONTAINING PROTEIN-RELATED [Salix koriyanagi]|uniref:COMM DOMAIN-CONTAINING PROTEIN-RELATED n=1 Tax=Salix koriyanagi TaxID=2511006 RepID=A0A9Q0TSR8_9ROSI|nr:COMM DOMAIN-CONTAINING PROTEIN-RELATED [Salix koriyanagi]